jgi:hypothetical protein
MEVNSVGSPTRERNRLGAAATSHGTVAATANIPNPYSSVSYTAITRRLSTNLAINPEAFSVQATDSYASSPPASSSTSPTTEITWNYSPTSSTFAVSSHNGQVLSPSLRPPESRDPRVMSRQRQTDFVIGYEARTTDSADPRRTCAKPSFIPSPMLEHVG